MNISTSIIEDLIRSQVGKSAKYRVYDRQIRNPMNVVLDEAVRQSPKKFTVYWIEAGIPENFSLLGLEPTPLAFNIRFVEIASVFQVIITEPVSKDIRSDLSERLCLRFISELSLSYGDPEFAALSFVKSILGQSYHIPTTNRLYDLEFAPLDEAYMVTWFFGLVHEVGHIFANNRMDSLLDEILQNAFENGPDKFYYANFPKELKDEARKRAKKSGSILSIENLRTEAASDIFAISVILAATIDICHRPEEGQIFHYDQFISQIIIFINILAIFQQCKYAAKIASHPVFDFDAYLDMLFAPFSLYARSLVTRFYLERAYSWTADRSKQKELDRVIDMNRKLINEN